MYFEYNESTMPIFDITFDEKGKASTYKPAGLYVRPSKSAGAQSYMPIPYRVMQNVSSISVCIHQNAAIDFNNTLWTWGARFMAQIEGGAYSNDVPQDVEFRPQRVLENALMVSCGAWHTLCITKDKKLWAWGSNDFGQLGVGDFSKREYPTFVMDCVESVCANEYQTFAIKEDHTLWGWGDNEFGTMLDDAECSPTPKLLMDSVVDISCGSHIVAAIKQDGTLWAWGNNIRHTIFTQAQYRQCPPSFLMEGIDKVVLPVSENCDFGLAITKSGDLYCFGGSKFGSIINTQIRKQQGAMPIKLIRGISNAYVGNDFIYILDKYGRLLSFGRNDLGQCGNGKSSSPLKKPNFVMSHVLEAAAGHCHGMGLQDNGDLWIWGGDYGNYIETPSSDI